MAMSDDENDDGLEDEVTDQKYHEKSSDNDNDNNDGSRAESESSADETELSRKCAPKVSSGLNSIQIRILSVTSRVKKRRWELRLQRRKPARKVKQELTGISANLIFYNFLL